MFANNYAEAAATLAGTAGWKLAKQSCKLKAGREAENRKQGMLNENLEVIGVHSLYKIHVP